MENPLFHYTERRAVKPRFLLHPACLLSILLVILSGCATTPAPDIRGRWKPINRYSEHVQEIPLYQSYVFHPSPMDRTLKNMLARWARDSKMTLAYQHPSDFTLHAPVAMLRTSDLQQAVAHLSSLYAGQGIAVTSEGNQIVVRAADATTADPPHATTGATANQ